MTRKRDRGEDERRRRCGVGRGDNDADEAAESLGLAVGQPVGRRHMELPGHGCVRASWPPGCCDRQPVKAPWTPWQGFRWTKLEALGASG